jgi:predicted HAD superfamily hydrolase
MFNKYGVVKIKLNFHYYSIMPICENSGDNNLADILIFDNIGYATLFLDEDLNQDYTLDQFNELDMDIIIYIKNTDTIFATMESTNLVTFDGRGKL